MAPTVPGAHTQDQGSVIIDDAPTSRAPTSFETNAKARDAMTRGHLVSPYDGSAVQLLNQALERSPLDDTLLLLRSDLSEAILAQVLTMIDDERLSGAGELLEHARALDPDHPNLPAVSRRLHNAGRFTIEHLPIHRPDLNSRSRVLQQQLSALGQRIVASNASITIRTHNDAAARWTYQQLSRDVDQRISATMEYGAPPGITIRWPPLDQ